jgi:autotransporter-associated beta strand protein
LSTNLAQYTNFFAGALSRVRIHTGTLSEQDILNNYLADAQAYNAAGSTTWTGGSANWNATANWTNDTVGTSGKAVQILSGSVSVTNSVAPGLLEELDIINGTVELTESGSRIDTKTPFILGRDSENTATLNLERGTIAVSSSRGPAFIDMGFNGAESTLSLGGMDTMATLSASRIQAFADGTADIQIRSGALLELDGVQSDTLTNTSMSVAGGTLRNRSGSTMGYLHNIPQVKISTGGVIFDAVAGSTMAVASSLLHDDSDPAGGGLRKTGSGTLVLSSTNTYAGDTSVEAGVLALSPRLLDGLVYQLDSSSNALSTLQMDAASNVVSWADANDSGILFTTNKTEISPVYDSTLFGGRGGLRFTRDSTICRLAANRETRVQSVFAVISTTSGNNNGGLWGSSENDYGIRVYPSYIEYAGNANDFASTGWMYMNGISGKALTIGQPIVMTAISGSARNWTTAIGDYWGNTTHRRVYKGDIAEILVYDRRLDDHERQEVEAYLMAKWLGTVPAPQFSSTLLPENTAMSIQSGASVELGGTSAQLSSLSGVGSIGNKGSALSTLKVGGLDASSIYTGSITGNVALTKIGNGQIELAGMNTYEGATTVEAGTLRLITGIYSVTGLVYRLDASLTNTINTLIDGSNVTSWADAEGSEFSFHQTASTNCPVYDATLFSGRGGIRFGIGGRKRMVAASTTKAQTVFAVNMLRDMSNVDNCGLWGESGADHNGIRIGSGNGWRFPGDGNDFHQISAGGSFYINGVISNNIAIVGAPYLLTSVSGSQKNFKAAIGDYWFSASYTQRYYRGEVAEILVYDRQLTDLERKTVETALMAKWFPENDGPIIPESAAVSVATGATLDLSGGTVTIASLAGSGMVSNGTLTVTGNISPEGTLKFTATPTLTGTLMLDILADGSCDSLAVNGPIDVSGLDLVLNLPETVPTVGSYTLVSASGDVTGTFASATTEGPWTLVYNPSSIQLIYASGTLIMVR